MADVVFSAPGAAYRADTTGRPEPFGPSDDDWLTAATELHLAVMTSHDQQQGHLFSAIGVAIALLDDEWIGVRGM